MHFKVMSRLIVRNWLGDPSPQVAPGRNWANRATQPHGNGVARWLGFAGFVSSDLVAQLLGQSGCSLARWRRRAGVQVKQPLAPCPRREIVPGEKGRHPSGAQVVANLLVPWFEAGRSVLTQVLLELARRFPEQVLLRGLQRRPQRGRLGDRLYP